MTVAEMKKVLDELPDEYEIPVLTWLFKENHPYLVSEDFHRFMERMDEKDLDIKDICWELSLLGDSQEDLGKGHLVNNIWEIVNYLQKPVKEEHEELEPKPEQKEPRINGLTIPEYVRTMERAHEATKNSKMVFK